MSTRNIIGKKEKTVGDFTVIAGPGVSRFMMGTVFEGNVEIEGCVTGKFTVTGALNVKSGATLDKVTIKVGGGIELDKDVTKIGNCVIQLYTPEKKD